MIIDSLRDIPFRNRILIEILRRDSQLEVEGGAEAWGRLPAVQMDVVHDGNLPEVNKFMINKEREEERRRDAKLEEEKKAAGYTKSKKEAAKKEADPYLVPTKWMLK